MLPTNVGLNERVPVIYVVCGVCDEVEESSLHVLTLCKLAKGVCACSAVHQASMQGCCSVTG